jgi:hypothetical protein
MPAFGGTLDEAARRAVVAYTRTLSLTNIGLIGRTAMSPASTAEVATGVLGAIHGRIINGTEGGAAASGIMATLHILDSQFNGESLETNVGEDGLFVFNDVSIRNDRFYVATANYRGRIFGSQMVTGDSFVSSLDLPITIYEPTQDISAITITNFTMQIVGAPGSLQISQIVNFKNESDRVFSQDILGDAERYVSVTVPLPQGGQVLDTAGDSQRYVLSEDSRTLLDTRPVLPGENHSVHILYALPYENRTDIQIPLDYALDGPVQLLVQPETLSVSSEQLEPRAPQTINGVPAQDFGATLSLAAGDMLNFSILNAASNLNNQATAPNLLAYALIALGSLALLGAAVIYTIGRRTSTANSDLIREIIAEQIAALDDLHAQGKIETAAYEAQRAHLKARLTRLMEKMIYK